MIGRRQGWFVGALEFRRVMRLIEDRRTGRKKGAYSGVTLTKGHHLVIHRLERAIVRLQQFATMHTVLFNLSASIYDHPQLCYTNTNRAIPYNKDTALSFLLGNHADLPTLSLISPVLPLSVAFLDTVARGHP
ncbi:hypothetical protein EV421DRAFT_1742280 [Armillaria borealis]|uniref:Uncharacterized protein n=1 Tax=Armillaria borealis TaxID=47425 RepID=A0AA39J0A3_9AGAR|nr:hypothetical protein EV421DRAFT_1742280 [Armillaria borealis]